MHSPTDDAEMLVYEIRLQSLWTVMFAEYANHRDSCSEFEGAQVSETSSVNRCHALVVTVLVQL